MARVLIVEDCQKTANSLETTLHGEMADVDVVYSLNRAYDRLQQVVYDLVIYDRRLGDGDGIELGQFIKETSYQTRLMCISGLGSWSDRVDGLMSGADDYLSKPFSLDEFKLRTRRLLATIKLRPNREIKIGNFIVDTENKQIRRKKRILKIRKKEYQLINFLARHPNIVVTREQISEQVWPETVPSLNTIDCYILRVRNILGRDSWRLQTIRGYGYRFLTR